MAEFNNSQFKQLAEFLSNLSLIFLATVIAPLFAESQEINLLLAFAGVALSAGFLILSLWTIKENKE